MNSIFIMGSKGLKNLIILIIGVVSFLMISKLIKIRKNSEEKNIEFRVKAKVIEDDVFQFFYWQVGDDSFKIKNSIKVIIKGGVGFQEIRFKLPPLKELYKIRLDIGENANQKKIVINSVKFVSNEIINELDVEAFNKQFLPNKYIKLNEGGDYIGIQGGKGKNSFYDPYFVANGDMFNMIAMNKKQFVFIPYVLGFVFSIMIMIFLFKNKDKISISLETVFISIFFILLIAPVFQSKFSFVKKLDNLEKRKLAEKPKFTFTQKFTQNFETYLDDNFGFRNQLVQWGANLKTKVFQSSIHPNKVMLGKGKWLFYNHIKNTIYKSYRNENLFTDSVLRGVVNQWEKKSNSLESNNKRYYIAFWPNKHSIYPEFLPNSMAVQIKDTLSRVNQIKAYLKQNNVKVHFIDVRPEILKGKKEHQLYHKFDTHWNDYGAFLGYQSFFNQVMDELKITPYQLDDFNVDWSLYSGGDLIPMLGIRNNGFFEEQQPKFTFKNNTDQIKYLSSEGYPKMTTITRNRNIENRLKVLVFRDSYTSNLIQFFSLHFYEVYYIWGHKEGFIEKLNPDVVIDCFVERDIGEKHTINKL